MLFLQFDPTLYKTVPEIQEEGMKDGDMDAEMNGFGEETAHSKQYGHRLLIG